MLNTSLPLRDCLHACNLTSHIRNSPLKTNGFQKGYEGDENYEDCYEEVEGWRATVRARGGEADFRRLVEQYLSPIESSRSECHASDSSTWQGSCQGSISWHVIVSSNCQGITSRHAIVSSSCRCNISWQIIAWSWQGQSSQSCRRRVCACTHGYLARPHAGRACGN